MGKNEKKFDTGQAYNLYISLGSGNIAETAKKYCDQEGIEYKDKHRRNLSSYISRSSDRRITPDMAPEKILPVVVDGKVLDIEDYCNHYGLPYSDVKGYKLVTHSGSGAYYNIQFVNKLESDQLEEFGAKLLEEIKNIPNLPKSIKRDKIKEEAHLLVVDVADLHIGKYSSAYEVGEKDAYNSEIAVKRALEGVEGILGYASGWEIDKILFVAGNDMLHTDNAKGSTTSLTPQSVDKMWFENFLTAKALYIQVIDRLLQEADVQVVFNPDNHSYVTGFMLLHVIEAYYKDCNNVTFDCSIAHRKYFTYGKNLIGSVHGDGGKLETLPMTMANEAKDWSNCNRRYMYIHHFHHRITKDYPGVTITAVRTASGADSWHHRNQYQGCKKSIEGFIHHKEMGRIASLSYNFN